MNTKLILAAAFVAGFTFWATRTEHESRVQTVAEGVIRSKMSRPETADFTDVRVFKGSNSGWCVIGSASALNRHGSRSYRRFIVTLSHEGSWKNVEYDFAFYECVATSSNLLFENP
jgi:hypothetical protein